VNVVCCQVEVSALDLSLVQRSPIECGVSECDREYSIMRGLVPVGPLRRGKKNRVSCSYNEHLKSAPAKVATTI